MLAAVALPTSGTLARSLFTLTYTIVFFILALSAKACYEATIQASLLQNRPLPLVRAIGWRSGGGVFTAWRKTGLFPMGWWYPVMLFIVMASYTTHYLTNTIGEGETKTLCRFTNGSILDRYQIMANPSPWTNDLGYTQNSQSYANSAGCAVGIYKKIPKDYGLLDTGFCPQNFEQGSNRSDVLGTWRCSSTVSVPYPANYSDEDVRHHGFSAGYLFNNSNGFRWSNNNSDNVEVYNQIILWSASTERSQKNVTWSIKFGLEVNSTWSLRPFVFNYYDCHLERSPSDMDGLMDRISRTIDTTRMLDDWSRTLPRYLYSGYDSPARQDVEPQMAMLLNSIIMISGSSDFINGNLTDQDPFYGCIYHGSVVPDYVIAYMAFSTALCVFFIAWYTLLKIRLHFLVRGRPSVQAVPTDMSTWAAVAAQLSPKARMPRREKDIMPTSMDEPGWSREQPRDQKLKIVDGRLVIYKDHELLLGAEEA